MAQKSTQEEIDLYKRIDEVLHYIWDPIGVAGVPQARDEYFSYLPHVFRILKQNGDAKEIEDYLIDVEQDAMGLAGNRNRAREAADIMVDWKEKTEAKE